ncbi:MAG: RNA-binding protein [Salaquimonas sp.]
MQKRNLEGEDELNPRSCIVSKERHDRQELIRFVAGPENKIFPDLKETLPGRGVWVEAKKSSVETAVAKRLFAKGLKTDVRADDDLPDMVENLLAGHALQALALAKKAGLLVTGFAKVDSAIRSNKVGLLIHANDAADDGKRKLASAVAFVKHMGGREIPVASCWSGDEMSAVLGLGNAMHAAAQPGGATRNLIAAVNRLQYYQAG